MGAGCLATYNKYNNWDTFRNASGGGQGVEEKGGSSSSSKGHSKGTSKGRGKQPPQIMTEDTMMLLNQELPDDEDMPDDTSLTGSDMENEAGDGQVPSFFAEILVELEHYVDKLGGLRHFKQKPFIERKVRRRDFTTAYTDYEFVYLTILGLAFLHANSEVIIAKNNGDAFKRNPGVQMLERVCGITMHARREGSNHLLRIGPQCLVEAFQMARTSPRNTLHFFKSAFDRTAGPCLEGRVSHLMHYIETARTALDPEARDTPPWEDVSLRPLLSDASPQDVVAEHLRIFLGECTWKWSRSRRISYDQAKDERFSDEHSAEFAQRFNTVAFKEAMLARGIASNIFSQQWEANTKSNEWVPYKADANDKVARAKIQGVNTLSIKLGPKAWNYEIDLSLMVQRNAKSGVERPIRCVERPPENRVGCVTPDELDKAIAYFVELTTLPEVVPGASNMEAGPSANVALGSLSEQLHVSVPEDMPGALNMQGDVSAHLLSIASVDEPHESLAEVMPSTLETGASGDVPLVPLGTQHHSSQPEAMSGIANTKADVSADVS